MTGVYEKQKDRINIACLVIIIFAFMYFVCLPRTHANVFSDIADSINHIVDFFVNHDYTWLTDLTRFTLSSSLWMINAVIYGTDINGSATDSATALNGFFTEITGDPDNNYSISSSTFFTAVSSFSNILKSVAAFLIIIIACGRLFSNIEKGMEGPQAVMKVLVEIGMAGTFVVLLDKILGALTGIGVQLIGYVSSDMDAEAIDELVTSILVDGCGLDSDGTDNIGLVVAAFLKLAVPIIMSLLIFAASGLAVIQTVIEIFLRRLFAPIAVVDIYQEGLRSPGVRYLKRYFATFVKLMIIAVVGTMTPTLIGYIAEEMSNVILFMLLICTINLSAIGLMFKAGEIANDVVGA